MIEERKEFYVSIGIWVVIFICVAGMMCLGGCAGHFQAIKTDKGIEFKGNKQGFEMSYKEDKDGNIEASVNSKGEPLINIGQLPDIGVTP